MKTRKIIFNICRYSDILHWVKATILVFIIKGNQLLKMDWMLISAQKFIELISSYGASWATLKLECWKGRTRVYFQKTVSFKEKFSFTYLKTGLTHSKTHSIHVNVSWFRGFCSFSSIFFDENFVGILCVIILKHWKVNSNFFSPSASNVSG